MSGLRFERLRLVKGLDVEAGVASAGGIQEKFEDVIITFADDLHNCIAKCKDFLDAGDIKSFQSVIRDLGNALGSAGCTEYSKRAHELEKAADASNLAFLRESYPALQAELSRLSLEVIEALKD